jgi:hypothetical protein
MRSAPKPTAVLPAPERRCLPQKKGGHNRRVAGALARRHHQQDSPVCRWARLVSVDRGQRRAMQRGGSNWTGARRHLRAASWPGTATKTPGLPAHGYDRIFGGALQQPLASPRYRRAGAPAGSVGAAPTALVDHRANAALVGTSQCVAHRRTDGRVLCGQYVKPRDRAGNWTVGPDFAEYAKSAQGCKRFLAIFGFLQLLMFFSVHCTELTHDMHGG